MRNRRISLIATILCLSVSCSPRDFLSRRLAADLIVGSDTFKSSQQFWLRTGMISNKDYLSPEYLVLERRGWINAVNIACSPGGVTATVLECGLSPLGVETFRSLVPGNTAPLHYFSVPVARRQLLAITGIAKSDGSADIDFQWKWIALNEVGAALYPGDVHYNSTVAFKHYDDGWRVIEGSAPKTAQGLDEALRNAEPAR